MYYFRKFLMISLTVLGIFGGMSHAYADGDYLTETDKISIKNGLKVYGKEHLNQTLEDFE